MTKILKMRPPIVENPDGTPAKIQLPPICSIDDFFEQRLVEPPQLVEGVLHTGTKMILGGGSKSFKTWTLMDMAVALATGGKWLNFQCTESKVLFINMEILPWFARKRFEDIKIAKRVIGKMPNLHVWNLRGYAADIEKLEQHLIAGAEAGGYKTIILDPVYKVQGARDENSNGDISELLNALERITVELEAAVVFGHHFAKGNASGKYAIDRMSGAGAWARDPDTIITMTPHKEEDCFTVEFILRNQSPVESFVVRREHPLMVRVDDLDPNELREPGKKKTRTVDEIVYLLPDSGGVTATEWMRLASEQEGIHKTRFYELKKIAHDKGKVKEVDGKIYAI